MSRIRALTATASVVMAAALLTGCTAPAPSGGAGGDAPSEAPPASGDFCTEFEANGGDGATVGVVLTFAAKEEILADAQPRLDAMGDLEPPDEIAAEWDVMKQYYADVVTAAEALPDGASFNASPEYPALAEAPDEYQVVTDYYFATC
jgi:hypothetical protein